MKYYAVKVGKTTGVFDNWAECQEAVKGFPSADYKSFATREEANAYIGNIDLYLEAVKADIEQGYIVAYCDGSYDEKKDRYSYGVLIIDKELQEHEICGSSQNTKYTSSHNIIGEVLGVLNALDWALSNGYGKIKIYHDYEGLSKWLSGEWEAKCDVAKMFVYTYQTKFSEIIQVSFEKVKGHSNNKYNEKADELASRALSDNARVPISGDSWFSIPYIKSEELQALCDLLAGEHPETNIEKDEKPNSIVYKLKLDKSRLSVTWFKGGNKKLLVQGANTILFQMFITFANDMIGVEEKQVFSSAYRKTIDRSTIDAGVETICPTFPVDYPVNIKRLIRQAVINLNYCIECEDYSQYVFPALRALEGHMKYLFGKAGVSITSKSGFNRFQKDDVTQLYYLPSGIISDTGLKIRLEVYYNFYNRARHTIFHFGDIMGSTDSTRILESKSEADELIKKCLSYICEE